MDKNEKILGEQRRKLILTWLKQGVQPMTGQALANETNVSRQVIVQDISLLKAAGEPIIATARGYLYIKDNPDNRRFKKVIAVRHNPDETAKELYTLVDYGVSVQNVIVEHPIYGELIGSLLLNSRYDVDEFLRKMKRAHASLLSRLTDGVHLHTIEADALEQFDKAVNDLRKVGILLES